MRYQPRVISRDTDASIPGSENIIDIVVVHGASRLNYAHDLTLNVTAVFFNV